MAENGEVGDKVLHQNMSAPCTPGVSSKQNLQPRERHTPEGEEGVGPPPRADSEHSWEEKRELGLLSDWRELGLH